MSLQHGDVKEISVKLADGRHSELPAFRSFGRAKNLVFPSNASYAELSCYQWSYIALNRGPLINQRNGNLRAFTPVVCEGYYFFHIWRG